MLSERPQTSAPTPPSPLTVQTGTGTLGGTTTGTITNGTHSVTIAGVTYDKAEAGVVLHAARTSGNSLTAANSNAFTVTAGTPTKLLISNPGAQQAGVSFSVTVTSADQYDNASAVTGARTITLTLGSGTGNLNGTKVRSIADGQSSVTFTGLSFDDISDAKVIHAAVTSGGALTAANSAAITVTAGPATKLAIQTIANKTAGATFSVVVHSHDQYDNDANVLYTTHVTLSVDTGTSTLNGTLTGNIPTGQSTVTLAGLSYDLAGDRSETQSRGQRQLRAHPERFEQLQRNRRRGRQARFRDHRRPGRRHKLHRCREGHRLGRQPGSLQRFPISPSPSASEPARVR